MRKSKDEIKRTKGWFVTPDREGDRTLDQQVRGLEPFFAQSHGKSVLDIGCAEGLIAMEAARRGALAVHGVEIVPGHVALAQQLAGDLPCTFEVADANNYRPVGSYDVVLMLAILHKLWNPTAACARFAAAAREMCVIRLQADGKEQVVDARSRMVPHAIGDQMRANGFVMDRYELGPFNEGTWYYRRGAGGRR